MPGEGESVCGRGGTSPPVPLPFEGDRAGRVYINAEQYFDGVSPQVWADAIGGYQVAEKWLKDRKGRTLSYADIEHYERTLSYADIEHYERTIAALAETITLMERIDETIEEHGGWPLG